MRTIEIKEISYDVEKEGQQEIIKKLKEVYGNELDILQENGRITVKGDLRNYKKRSRILYILSRGKHGENL